MHFNLLPLNNEKFSQLENKWAHLEYEFENEKSQSQDTRELR